MEIKNICKLAMNGVFYIITQGETLFLSDFYLKDTTYVGLLTVILRYGGRIGYTYLAVSRYSINSLNRLKGFSNNMLQQTE